MSSFDDNLLSMETLDRTSPELWPEPSKSVILSLLNFLSCALIAFLKRNSLCISICCFYLKLQFGAYILSRTCDPVCF